MMMVPYMFNDGLMDDLFSDAWAHDFDRAMRAAEPRSMFGKRAANVMKTDVRENKDSYDVFVDLPGFKKDEINVEIADGYLTIQASKGLDKDQQDKDGKYIRQERYAGSCSRSFYIGEDVPAEDISAKYEDGILRLSVPKADQKELPKTSTIAIE